MDQKPTIAIVHQSTGIMKSIGLAFECEGFGVRIFEDGLAALEFLSATPADIAIFGRTLPLLRGPDLFRRLRQFTDMPVIFLSSYGADLADEIPGADDYLETTTSIRHVVATAKVVLKRHQSANRQPAPPPYILHKRLVIDTSRCICHWGRERVYLNVPEYLILVKIAAGSVHTRIALMAAAYGNTIDVDQEVIDDHIASMVKKFRQIDPGFDMIELVSGVVYRLKQA